MGWGKTSRAIGAVVVALAGLGACSTTEGTTADSSERRIWVRDLELTQQRGQVGTPFRAQLWWRDNYIRQPEVNVSGLPPGLRYDAATRMVTGTPTRAGFFTVNLAVRQRPPTERAHRVTPEERWWPATAELEIFNPPEVPSPGGAPAAGEGKKGKRGERSPN